MATKIRLTSQVQDTLPIANGGTGSSTQNFVDLSKNQTVGGNKTFTGLTIGAFTLPEGTVVNGKIVPSVSGGNLTVALKTYAGTDPSPTDPVYAMIGGVMRSITSALSLTHNTASNWLNLGSAELATKETDLFVYLFWYANASTPRVGIGFSRLPYANKAGDMFPGGNVDNERKFLFDFESGKDLSSSYAVINIGRFAATLSAGPVYTWSVPTFDSSNLIQRPCYETRELSVNSNPVFDAGSATFASYSTYKIIGRSVTYNVRFNYTSLSSAVAYVCTISKPIQDNFGNYAFHCLGDHYDGVHAVTQNFNNATGGIYIVKLAGLAYAQASGSFVTNIISNI